MKIYGVEKLMFFEEFRIAELHEGGDDQRLVPFADHPRLSEAVLLVAPKMVLNSFLE